MKVLLIWTPWKTICKEQQLKTKLQILDKHQSRFSVKNTLGEGLQFLLLILCTLHLILLIWPPSFVVQVLHHLLYFMLVYWTRTLSLWTRGWPCQLRCGWQPNYKLVEISPSLPPRLGFNYLLSSLDSSQNVGINVHDFIL